MSLKSQTYQSALFKLNKSQAVRIPKKLAFSDDIQAVNVVRRGASIILTPVDHTWDAWFDAPSATDDYMTSRDQPEDQEREGL